MIFDQTFEEEKMRRKKNQFISAKQPNLMITRNGFDIIVN